MTHPIVFFDGVCGFCDRSVTFLFARDRRHVLRFATLQGQTAARLLSEDIRQDLDTMIFLESGRVHKGSSAAILSLAAAGGPWRLATALLIIPRFFRDAVYDAVAKRRYQIFGKHDSCRMPTPAERDYFLP